MRGNIYYLSHKYGFKQHGTIGRLIIALNDFLTRFRDCTSLQDEVISQSELFPRRNIRINK